MPALSLSLLAAATKEKERARLADLDQRGRAVPARALDPLMSVLVQVMTYKQSPRLPRL